MAYLKTDSAHYEAIASAIRALHEGRETYTPARMGEYLAAEGTELKSENIAEGVTIFGVTGTMKHDAYAEWPPDIPPEPEFDIVVGEVDPNAPDMDKMLLMDDKGNVTVGYLYNTPVTERYNYGGAALPPPPEDWDESDYTNACVAVTYNQNGTIASAKFYCATGALGYDARGGYATNQAKAIMTNGSRWCTYALKTYTTPMEWGTPSYENEGTNPWNNPSCVTTLDGKQEIIWANKSIYKYVPVIDGNDPYINSEVWLAGSACEPAKFTVTAYNYRTTDFRAIGWIRVAYHSTGENAGQYTIDDFRTSESGGWNYIKNVRWCSRAKLEHIGIDIWPKGPQMYNYGGYLSPVKLEDVECSYSGYTYIYATDSNTGLVVEASKKPLVRNTNDYLGVDNSHTAFDLAKMWICAPNGRAIANGWEWNTLNGAYGRYIKWSNYTINGIDGGTPYEKGPDPVPVRIPDY